MIMSQGVFIFCVVTILPGYLLLLVGLLTRLLPLSYKEYQQSTSLTRIGAVLLVGSSLFAYYFSAGEAVAFFFVLMGLVFLMMTMLIWFLGGKEYMQHIWLLARINGGVFLIASLLANWPWRYLF